MVVLTVFSAASVINIKKVLDAAVIYGLQDGNKVEDLNAKNEDASMDIPVKKVQNEIQNPHSYLVIVS